VSERGGGERFADAARQLAGQSALLLGWRPHEFWSATPAELAAIFAAQGDATPPPGLGRDHFKHLLERDGDG
jgi:hypothetical protein